MRPAARSGSVSISWIGSLRGVLPLPFERHRAEMAERRVAGPGQTSGRAGSRSEPTQSVDELPPVDESPVAVPALGPAVPGALANGPVASGWSPRPVPKPSAAASDERAGVELRFCACASGEFSFGDWPGPLNATPVDEKPVAPPKLTPRACASDCASTVQKSNAWGAKVGTAARKAF